MNASINLFSSPASSGSPMANPIRDDLIRRLETQGRGHRHPRPGLRRAAADAALRRGRLQGHRLRHRLRTRSTRSNAGRSYIEHIRPPTSPTRRRRGFEATTDCRARAEADALIICVPTPLNKYREPDLSFVLDTTDALVPYLRAGPGRLAGEHDLSGHDRGGAAAADRARRASRSARTSSWSSRRNARIRATRTSAPRRSRRSAAASRRPASRSGMALYGQVDRPGGPGELHAGGRDDQAAGEHPPRGQHRPGQRDEDHRRPDGHRHPRGDPGRGHQALRLRGLLSRARASAATAFRSTRST